MSGVNLQNDIYELLFESATEGLAVVDSKGIIRLTNPRLNKMFGYKKDELIGQYVEILVPMGRRKGHVEHRDKYTRSPHSRSMGIDMDLSGTKKNGKEFPVEVSLNQMNKNGEVLIMALITDITERRKAKEELVRLNEELESRVQDRTKELDNVVSALQFSNEDLLEEVEIRKKAEKKAQAALDKEKELNELKSRFVSMASHEFRTPLSTILTSVSLIDKYSLEDLEKKRKKHINRIKSSVRNLTSILNDFLSLDKLEEGKIELYIKEFDIIELCTDTVEEMQSVARAGQIIKYEHKGSSNTFTADLQLLKNVIVNLFSNAIKYSPEDKIIRLTTEQIDSRLIVTVADDGMGIPQADQVHMFDKFFRAKNSLNIQGTGLGLNIVKRYLSLLNGKISFKSVENKGTTFTFEIPKGGLIIE